MSFVNQASGFSVFSPLSKKSPDRQVKRNHKKKRKRFSEGRWSPAHQGTWLDWARWTFAENFSFKSPFRINIFKATVKCARQLCWFFYEPLDSLRSCWLWQDVTENESSKQTNKNSCSHKIDHWLGCSHHEEISSFWFNWRWLVIGVALHKMEWYIWRDSNYIMIISGTVIPKRHEPKSYEAGKNAVGLFLKIYTCKHVRTQ